MLIYDNAPNIFINSDMRLRQRFSGSLTSLSGPAIVTYYLDRWKSRYTGNVTSPQVGQSSLPALFPGNPYIQFAHRMVGTLVDATAKFESFYIAESVSYKYNLSNKMSLGMWVWGNNFQNFRVEFYTPNVKDTWGPSVIYATQTYPLVDQAWNYISFENVDVIDDKGFSVGVYFEDPIVTGVTGDCYFTEVMCNPGSKIAKWKLRGKDEGEELLFAQRYYEKSYNIDDAPGTVTFNGSLRTRNVSTTWFAQGFYLANKRTGNGVITTWSPQTGTASVVYNDQTVTDVAAFASAGGDKTFGLRTSANQGAGNLISAQWTCEADF